MEYYSKIYKNYRVLFRIFWKKDFTSIYDIIIAQQNGRMNKCFHMCNNIR